jgi:hypothetical protein
VILAYQCIRCLVRRTKTWTFGCIALLAYTTLLFALQTIYFVAGCKWSEIEFVETQVDPAVFASQQSSMLAVLKDTVYTVNIWVADAFIVSISLLFMSGRLISVVALPSVYHLGRSLHLSRPFDHIYWGTRCIFSFFP